MRGLANLDYGKKILITNGVKEEFKNIEIQERARLKLYVNEGYPAVNKIVCLGLGELFLLTFGFKEVSCCVDLSNEMSRLGISNVRGLPEQI